MIKKTIAVISTLLLTTTLVWAVWEGNAAVGSARDFPEGLFAHSNVFPKNTLIEIINLEQHTQSRAIVIKQTGASGVLLEVSPALAKALAIETGATVRVRVSAPSPVSETGAEPFAGVQKNAEVPSAGKDTPALAAAAEKPAEKRLEPPAPVAELSEPKQPVKKAQPRPAPVAEKAVPVKPVQKKAARPAPVTEATAPVKPAVKTAARPLPVMETAPVKPAQKKAVRPAPVAETAAPVKPAEKKNEIPSPVMETAEPVKPAAERQAVLPVPETTEPIIPEEKPSAIEAVASVPETVKPIRHPEEVAEPVPDVSQPVPAEKDDGDPLLALAESVKDIAPIIAPPKPAEPEVREVEPIATQPVQEKPSDTEAAAEAPDMNDSQQTDPANDMDVTRPVPIAQSIALIPSGPKEPVGPVPELPPKKAAKPKPPSSAAPQPSSAAAQPESSAVQPKSSAVQPNTSEKLQKGSFYVQVGLFSDSLNVQSFVHRYGKQYPIAVEEKIASGKQKLYTVYVGPLKKDERGAAVETFRKLGFKDAFVKKAP